MVIQEPKGYECDVHEAFCAYDHKLKEIDDNDGLDSVMQKILSRYPQGEPILNSCSRCIHEEPCDIDHNIVGVLYEVSYCEWCCRYSIVNANEKLLWLGESDSGDFACKECYDLNPHLHQKEV